MNQDARQVQAAKQTPLREFWEIVIATRREGGKKTRAKGDPGR